MLRFKRRRGFTLVELLIVIIIIGILAGSMMLTMGKARAKARATRIVSNLRTLQKAAMMYYCDNGAWYPGTPEEAYTKSYGSGENSTAFLDECLVPYLEGKLIESGHVNLDGQPQYYVWVEAKKDGETYSFQGVYAVCWVSDDYEDYATRKCLEEMCQDIPLFNANLGEFTAESTQATNYHQNGSQIILKIHEES